MTTNESINRLWSVAVHEAGHIVAAGVLGHHTLRASLTANGGITEHHVPDAMTDGAAIRSQAIVAWAGQAAELTMFGSTFDSRFPDRARDEHSDDYQLMMLAATFCGDEDPVIWSRAAKARAVSLCAQNMQRLVDVADWIAAGRIVTETCEPMAGLTRRPEFAKPFGTSKPIAALRNNARRGAVARVCNCNLLGQTW